MADGGTRGQQPAQTLDWQSALLDQARRGDVRAFERLYRETCARVHGLCLRLTHDPTVAEDCTQETYLRAWRALGSFEGRSQLTTWLHRIAVNVVIERRRRQGIQPEPLDGLDEAALGVTLDTPVEEREIERVIESLPAGARDALTLCAIYGYSHAEAAAMLGLAEGTCKAQLHRARSLLRARLEEGLR
ncbi:MAG: sigma-70 family RNA polymerase sigma factor [Steroidobacteraceae bacterium]